MIRSNRSLAARRGSPSMIALRMTLSSAARSGLKPTPSSMKVETRPAIAALPLSIR